MTEFNDEPFSFVDHAEEVLVKEFKCPNKAREILKKITGPYVQDRPYIGAKSKQEVKERNATIKREFNGTNHEELAKKYNLTPRQVRNII